METSTELLRRRPRSLALELGPLGIAVNTVTPGMTDTLLIGDIPEKVQLLTARQTPLRRLATPADIASENLLLLEDGHCLRDQALAACELESARRNTAFNGTSLHTLAQMVANGLGVTLMPQMALDAGIVRGLDVAVRPMADGTSHRRIGLVWRCTSARKETFRRLGEALCPFL